MTELAVGEGRRRRKEREKVYLNLEVARLSKYLCAVRKAKWGRGANFNFEMKY